MDNVQEHNMCIKIYLREIGPCGMDWIRLAQDRDQSRALVNTVMNLWLDTILENSLSDWRLFKRDSALWSSLVSYFKGKGKAVPVLN
jgi:hypothetical protein